VAPGAELAGDGRAGFDIATCPVDCHNDFHQVAV